MPCNNSTLPMIGALLVIFGFEQIAFAQTDYNWIGNDGNYAVGGNWDLSAPPTGAFDERAIINVGIARVSNTVVEPAEVMIAHPAETAASLVIESGGNLTVYDDDLAIAEQLASSLGVEVGLDGAGTLVVESGGSLAAANIIVRGAGSSVTFGGNGVSPTNVTIGTTVSGKSSGTNVFGGTSFRVVGPNINYSTANFDLEPGSVFVPEITGAVHSTISAPGGVVTEGALSVEFNGYSPGINDTWNLFDTTAISGVFSSIEATGDSLPLGQRLTFNTVPNGSLGFFGQLGIEQQLVLKVNRATGAMSIETGTETVSLDGYTIRSNLGGINPSQWNSLQDQAVSDWRESPQGGTETLVSELKPTTSTAVTSGSSLQLGNAFEKPLATVFGTQELEDIEFEYFQPDGTVVQGQVVYEGDKQFNNLVLVVDPVDGEAILQNQSNLSVAIDGYNIHSDSGSLLPGGWLSLEDQAISSWTESNPTSNDLSELNSDNIQLVSGGDTFNLGSLFQTTSGGGTEDLTFRYVVEGESEFTDGIVVYRDISDAPGDFNQDGRVNGADLLLWQRNPGIGNLSDWQANYGSPLATSVSAIPEPHTLALCITIGISLLVHRQRS